jgi:hypothetical protein
VLVRNGRNAAEAEHENVDRKGDGERDGECRHISEEPQRENFLAGCGRAAAG